VTIPQNSCDGLSESGWWDRENEELEEKTMKRKSQIFVMKKKFCHDS